MKEEHRQLAICQQLKQEIIKSAAVKLTIYKFGAAFLLALYFLVGVLVLRNSSEHRKEKKDANFTTEMFVLESPEEMSELIHQLNEEQRIYNENKYGGSVEVVIVVQVHKRPLYLEQLIQSLQDAPGINKTLLIFSHDWMDQTLDDMIQNVTFAKVLQIFYPLSLQTHPRNFPGPDSDDCVTEEEMKVHDCSNFEYKDGFGNFRNPTVAQIKHHWWWKANFVFKQVKILRDYHGLVLFLEEDHYVAPDFLHCLKLMETTTRYHCPDCWFYSLGNSNVNFEQHSSWVAVRSKFENLGLAFNRTVWGKISEFREYFCRFDDYNWDWSLQNLARRVNGGKSSVIMDASRVYHVGLCGTHFSHEVCGPMEVIEEFKSRQVNLFPESLYVMLNDDEVVRKGRNNGGWGDPRDQELCMET